MEFYNIKWQDFGSHTGNSFKDLLTEPDFLDVTLACDDDKPVSAHKVILSGSSDFFKNILLKNYHQRPLIVLDGVSHCDLLSVIDFIYTGSADVPKERLWEFMRVGRKLKVKGLMQSSDEIEKLIPQKSETLKKTALDNVKIHNVRVDLKNVSFDDSGQTNDDVVAKESTDSVIQSLHNQHQESMENHDEAAKSMKEEFVEHPSVFPVDEDSIEDDDDIVLVHNDYAKAIEKENNVDERTNVIENKSENEKANVEEPGPNILIEAKIKGKKQRKLPVLKCDECDHSVSDMDNLKMHKFYNHGRKIYKCDECNHKTQREKALVFHKQMKHSRTIGR